MDTFDFAGDIFDNTINITSTSEPSNHTCNSISNDTCNDTCNGTSNNALDDTCKDIPLDTLHNDDNNSDNDKDDDDDENSPPSSPSPTAENPFLPLPRSACQRFLFRAVFDSCALDPPLRMRPAQSTTGLWHTGRRNWVFEHHLSGSWLSPGGSRELAATPLASWYTSYGRAAARCRWLVARGAEGVKLLVAWAGALTLFDGEALARAFGYVDGGTDARRQLRWHTHELLTWGDDYLDPDSLVMHFDWMGPIVKAADDQGRTVDVPLSLLGGAARKLPVTWTRLGLALMYNFHKGRKDADKAKTVEELLKAMVQTGPVSRH